MPLLFLYGTSLPGHPENRWVRGLPAAPATVRGTLWRSPHNRPGLVPSPSGVPIRGLLVELEDARLPVLDLVEGAGDGVVSREAVSATSNLRPLPAQAWVIDPTRAARAGWRPLKAREWARVAP